MNAQQWGRRTFGALAAILGLGVQAAPVAPSRDQAPVVAEAPQAAVVRQRAIDKSFASLRVYRDPGFIWLGRPKRGNRRGRSRWDYNR